jgi:thymidylate synthase (FAD)
MLATTQLCHIGNQDFLEDVGAPQWDTNTNTAGQILIEIAGKLCYMSFSPELNANLTKVTQADNKKYIGNVIAQRHGSVLEHVSVTFAFLDVSRVFTHELVRHRLASFSQVSLRFVRLTDLSCYFPKVFSQPFLEKVREHLRTTAGNTDYLNAYANIEELEDYLHDKMREVYEYLEGVQRELATLLMLDQLDSFHDKKKLTSALRRMAPEGLATGIICTANLRMWRHMIEQRTARHAEEEIRLVFGQVFKVLSNEYPNVFQDAHVEVIDDMPEVTLTHSKV